MKKLFTNESYTKYKKTIDKKEYSEEKPELIGPDNRSCISHEVISPAKIERQMHKYIADNEKEKQRLAEVRLTNLAAAGIISKKVVRIPPRNPSSVERLKKFASELKKYEKQLARKIEPELKIYKVPPHRPENSMLMDQEKMATIYDPFQLEQTLGYQRHSSSLWDVTMNRAMELKCLLEDRERFFNGEMDEVYYKVGPNGSPAPAPVNFAVKSASSIISSRQGTSVIAIKSSNDTISTSSQIVSEDDPDMNKINLTELLKQCEEEQSVANPVSSPTGWGAFKIK